MRASTLSTLLILSLTFSKSSPPPPAGIQELIQNTPPGSTLHLSAEQIYQIRAPIVITKEITIDGGGATLVAAENVRISSVIMSDSVSNIRISNLKIDANADRGGADYGIWIKKGQDHHVFEVDIRNTGQACILLQDASGTISHSQFHQCGRLLTTHLGSAANNHAIMIAALRQIVKGIDIHNNNVTRAFRKGITTYARSPGNISDIRIYNNNVTGCGLGGIYIASAPLALPQRDITINYNNSSNNYVNYQVSDVIGLKMIRNYSAKSMDWNGNPGAEGLIVSNVRHATISDFKSIASGGSGITLKDSAYIKLLSPEIVNPNAGYRPFGPAIHFYHVDHSIASDVTIIDNRRHRAFTHAVLEDGGSFANFVTISKMYSADQGRETAKR